MKRSFPLRNRLIGRFFGGIFKSFCSDISNFVSNFKKSTHNVNNGCLGDFDRGRTQTAAILVGEVPSTFDPTVSEWSNPLFLEGPIINNTLIRIIVVWRGTVRTETSQ